MPRSSKVGSDPTLLEAALEGLQLQQQRIEEQIRHVRAMLGKRGASKPSNDKQGAPSRRRQLSPAARKRIAAAQKKRWAEYRKATPKGE